MKINFKTIGAELILGTMVLPWAVWITVSIFASQKVEAVQESKYDYIAKRLDEIRSDIKAMRIK
jgi:hypothetical protein